MQPSTNRPVGQKNNPSPSNAPQRRIRVRRGAALASVVAMTFAGIGFSTSANAESTTTSTSHTATLSQTSSATADSFLSKRKKPAPTTPAPTPTTPAPTPSTTPTSTPTATLGQSAGWHATSTMPTARTRQVSALLNDGRVLVAGGTAGRSAVLYNPSSRTWTSAASMPQSVYDGTAIALADGRVLVVGGGSATTQLYDPSSDTWSTGASLPTALHWTSAGLFPNGQVIVVGRTGAEAPAAVKYDPTRNRFTTLPSPATPSQTGPELSLMLPNGTFFTTYGTNGPSVYSPATNRWTNLGPAPTFLPDKVAIALLPNGNVMLAGGTNWGFGFPTATRTVMEVNPTTGAWHFDANMPRNSVYQNAYLFDGSELVSLGNGRILATGGFTSPDEDQVYDPQSDSWTAIPGRNAHGGTVIGLADGSVLVAGGYVDTAFPSLGTVTDQAFVFTP